MGFGLIRLDPVHSSALLERFTEVAVIVSLFTAGLKLRTPLSHRRWLLPVRLASTSMVVTVGLIAAAGVLLLDLPLRAAVLLGAVLAPTDPVLASDVQVAHPTDRDRLWFVPLLFFVVRPVVVAVGSVGSRITGTQRGLTCWFGIRGVGSVYYLAYALQHGVGGETARTLAALTLTTVAASIAVHGVSVTPLMNVYRNLGRRAEPRPRERL